MFGRTCVQKDEIIHAAHEGALLVVNARTFENADLDLYTTFHFYFLHFFLYYFLQLSCPSGISPTGNSGYLPRGKPAVTESRYPTYGACWMF